MSGPCLRTYYGLRTMVSYIAITPRHLLLVLAPLSHHRRKIFGERTRRRGTNVSLIRVDEKKRDPFINGQYHK